MSEAAIYCRSSKDRAEIGLETQRKELTAYAKANGFRVVAEFSDMEISGSLDEVSRPGLSDLLTALRSPNRAWGVLLAVDTSRIARDPMLGLYVQHECDKHDVQLRFSKIAVDGRDAVGEMLLAQLRAFDRFHSRLSAEKGRAGLQVNIANGYRAGGRAPLGYSLEPVESGAMRGGMPVRKSRLILDPKTSKQVQDFLRGRAEGTPRHLAAKQSGLGDKTQASLIALERNALTYAGFTVWNQRKKHKRTREDDRKTMLWRPRDEWIVSEKPNHEALISRDEAERILALVDKDNPRARARTVRSPDEYLLTGLLFTPAPDSIPYQADGKFYRVGRKGQRVARAAVDRAVLATIARDVKSAPFVGEVVQSAHDMAEAIEDNPQALDAALRKCEARIGRVTNAIAENGSSAALKTKLQELEMERDRLASERASAGERARLKRGLRSLTARDIEAMLEFAAVPLAGIERDVPYIRRSLAAFVKRVELEPVVTGKGRTRKLRIQYSVPLTGGAKVASPRGFEPRLPP